MGVFCWVEGVVGKVILLLGWNRGLETISPRLPWGTGGEKSPWGFRGKSMGSSCPSSAGFGAAAPSFVPGYPAAGLIVVSG